MIDLMDHVTAYFAQDNWAVRRHETEPLLKFEYETETGVWTVHVWVRQDFGQVLVYSLYPDPVPDPRRAAVAEYLTRANCGQILGAFEMDYATGEVRYRTGLDLRQAQSPEGLFGPVLKANLIVFGDHRAGLDAVCAGSATPAEAMARIEAEQPDLDFRG